jgi:hypothetical protein
MWPQTEDPQRQQTEQHDGRTEHLCPSWFLGKQDVLDFQVVFLRFQSGGELDDLLIVRMGFQPADKRLVGLQPLGER